MNHKKIVFPVLAFAILASLVFTTRASAAVVQWFPSDGTISDYEISYATLYNNNTRADTKIFDVYNYTTNLYVIPSNLHHVPSAGWISIANGTKVTWRHTYTPISSTQLNRTSSIVVNNMAYTNLWIRIYNSNSSYYNRRTTEITIQKTAFYSGSLSQAFLDYFNCTAHFGEEITYGYSVITTDGTQIIAMNNYTAIGMWGSFTYIADASGHVLRYIMADWNPGFYGSINAHGTLVNLVSIGQAGLFGEYTTYVVYGGIGVGGLVIGILIGYGAGKKKREK